MQWLWCCESAGAVQPAPVKTPDLVADLPCHTRYLTPNSLTFTFDNLLNVISIYRDSGNNEEKQEKEETENENEKETEKLFTTETVNDKNEEENVQRSRTPSIQIEDISEKSIASSETAAETSSVKSIIKETQENSHHDTERSPETKSASAKSSPGATTPSKNSVTSNISSASMRSQNATPEPPSLVIEKPPDRDVRSSLAECMIPARHEDWETIVSSLIETERLAKDDIARAPAASWRAATRSVAAHVRSLRSRVARAACSTMGALFENRGRCLDPELEEATSALLERCADVNRFLRADATTALGRVACGGNCARAGVALVRRGASHRAGPVRAAAAQALTKLVRQQGSSRILDLPIEPRVVILRAAGELLGDASPEARLHAKHLCLALSEDVRFRQMLKDAMPLSRYRAIEKYVDKLRCR